MAIRTSKLFACILWLGFEQIESPIIFVNPAKKFNLLNYDWLTGCYNEFTLKKGTSPE